MINNNKAQHSRISCLQRGRREQGSFRKFPRTDEITLNSLESVSLEEGEKMENLAILSASVGQLEEMLEQKSLFYEKRIFALANEIEGKKNQSLQLYDQLLQLRSEAKQINQQICSLTSLTMGKSELSAQCKNSGFLSPRAGSEKPRNFSGYNKKGIRE